MKFKSINEAIVYLEKNYSELKKTEIQSIYNFINSNEEDLTTWVYEFENTFFENDSYYFLIDIDSLFHTDEDILEYHERETLLSIYPTDVKSWISSQIQWKLDDPLAIHYRDIGGLLRTVHCSIWGQAGPHFSNFMIYSNDSDLITYLTESGYIICDPSGEILSHNDIELTEIYKRLVYEKIISTN